VAPDGSLDSNCVKLWSEETCKQWGTEQDLKATLFDSLQNVCNMSVNVFGKVDIGAGVLASYQHATADGFHGGPSISILTRSADIRKPTKANPMNITNDHDNHVHPEDWKMLQNCIDWLESKGKEKSSKVNDDSGDIDALWFLHCSLNIPHPPFDTNSTWLQSVNMSAVNVPQWPLTGTARMHPYDS